MNTAHEELAQIARAGAGRFAETSLASSHASVTRRVRRHRVARATVTSVAGIGVIGGAVWCLDAFRPGGTLAPGATMESTTAPSAATNAPWPSPIGEALQEPMRVVDTITIPRGTDLEAICAKLAAAYLVSPDDALAAITASVQQLAPEAATAEGWILPHTFDLTASPTLKDASDMLVAARVRDLTDLGVPRADWQTVITKASLVEREAKLNVDKPKIARVIDNRLAKGMKLEFDSTIKYIAPSEGVFTTDADRATDSPYNTYLYQGLPPGAIAAPSDDSIRDVLNPAEGDWLFFVTVNLDTGETAFASTFPEHQKNVQKLQEWINAQETPTPQSPAS